MVTHKSAAAPAAASVCSLTARCGCKSNLESACMQLADAMLVVFFIPAPNMAFT